MKNLKNICILLFIFTAFVYPQKSESDLIKNQVFFPVGASVDADMLMIIMSENLYTTLF